MRAGRRYLIALLLTLAIVFSALSSWLVLRVHTARRHREAAAALHEFETPCRSEVLPVGSLHFADSNITDAQLENVKWLSDITEVDLGNTQITDAGLLWLRPLRNLGGLGLGGTFWIDILEVV